MNSRRRQAGLKCDQRHTVVALVFVCHTWSVRHLSCDLYLIKYNNNRLIIVWCCCGSYVLQTVGKCEKLLLVCSNDVKNYPANKTLVKAIL